MGRWFSVVRRINASMIDVSTTGAFLSSRAGVEEMLFGELRKQFSGIGLGLRDRHRISIRNKRGDFRQGTSAVHLLPDEAGGGVQLMEHAVCRRDDHHLALYLSPAQKRIRCRSPVAHGSITLQNSTWGKKQRRKTASCPTSLAR